MVWWGVFDSKFIPWSTVKDHYATLVDRNVPGRAYWPDFLTLLGLPLIAGCYVGIRAQLRDMSSYIGGVAIFTALLFGLVIYIFQLRMSLLDNPNVPRDGALVSFIDQVFANVNYAVLVGVIATTLGMSVAVTAGNDGEVNRFWSAVLVAIGVHLMLVVLMCIKRLRAAYREIKKLPRSSRI